TGVQTCALPISANRNRTGPKEMTDPQLIVVDDNGIPDHIMNPAELTDDGFTLAAKIGASRGEQDKISAAIKEMLDKYPDNPGYVLTSALSQLGRDLVPMVASLAKTATGVDWHAHCEAMLSDDYDPATVDQK